MALLGPKIEWYTQPVEEVEEILETNLKKGLAESESKRRQQEYGKNIIKKKSKESFLEKIWKQVKNPLIFILIIAGVITLFLGEHIDTIVIFIAVLINVIIGLFQEGRAKKAFEKLQGSQVKKATVIREGRKKVIDAKDLVRGDIVVLEAGESVPADIRIAKSENLEVNESALTGEWVEVEKDTNISPRESQVTEQNGMTFMGTTISGGSAIGIVVEIGDKTEIGKIAAGLDIGEEETTPIQKNMKRISFFLTLIIMITIVVIFALGLVRGEPLGEMFLISVAVAVSVIPEGLPVAVTVVLALGMEQILKKGGLVRNLLAAETLGSTTIILTDKTGTLTEAKMRVASLYNADAVMGNNEDSADGRELLKIAVLASDAFIEEDNNEDGVVVRGRPIEKALILKGLEEGINQDELERDEYERIDFLPFDSETRLAASLNKMSNGKTRVFISGAPEHILKRSSKILKGGKEIQIKKEHRGIYEKTQNSKSREGYRFIAAAYKDTNLESFEEIESSDDFFQDLVYGGLISFEDPIRKKVKDSIDEAREAGTRIIMLTGDHKYTALKVAEDTGIAQGDTRVLEGKDIEKMNDKDLIKALGEVNIFARVLPSQKLRIAKALQGQGEIVAMTGDGINDAPALRNANIGVAVGSGTEVAKEASDLILLDNSFSIIVWAIEEGRKIIDNLKKIVAFLISTSFGEVFVIAGALLLGAPLPILPTQILWINIIEGGALNFSFAFEPAEPDLMKRNPKDIRQKNIVTKELRKLILIVGITTGILATAVYFILLSMNLPIEEIRTMMFAVLTLDAIFFTFAMKGLRTPIWKTKIFSNKYLLVAVGISALILVGTLTVPPLMTLLTIVPITFLEVIILGAIGLLNLLIIESAKYFVFSRRPST